MPTQIKFLATPLARNEAPKVPSSERRRREDRGDIYIEANYRSTGQHSG